MYKNNSSTFVVPQKSKSIKDKQLNNMNDCWVYKHKTHNSLTGVLFHFK